MRRKPHLHPDLKEFQKRSTQSIFLFLFCLFQSYTLYTLPGLFCSLCLICSWCSPLFYSRQSKYYTPPSESTRWSLKIRVESTVVVLHRVYIALPPLVVPIQVYTGVYLCAHRFILLAAAILPPNSNIFFSFSFRSIYCSSIVWNDWLPIAFPFSA